MDSNQVTDKPLPDSIAKVAQVFCGCGDPEMSWKEIHSCLRDADQLAGTYVTDGPTQLVAYLLDHLGLTDHGTSIYYHWLTDEGKEALRFFEEHGPRWKERGPWLDSDGVTWGYQ